MTSNTTPLMNLGKALNKAGFSAKLVEAPSSMQFQGMVLTLGSDRRGSATPLHLQIWDHQSHPGISEQVLVQMVAMLPFRFDMAQITDIVRFVLLLNSIAEFPGFGVEPAERILTHRYTMVSMGDHVDTATVVACVQMIDNMLARYSDVIEQVATGKCTLAEGFARLRVLQQHAAAESAASTKQRVPSMPKVMEEESPNAR